jgi:hypothetical protein
MRVKVAALGTVLIKRQIFVNLAKGFDLLAPIYVY